MVRFSAELLVLQRNVLLSNAKCSVGTSKIYDGLISQNSEEEKERIRYPINVEQAACQFEKPNINYIELQVADSQQQSGGSDSFQLPLPPHFMQD